jgi:hypothetical protein
MSDARRASALSSVRRGGDGRSGAADLEVVELGQGEGLDPLPGVEDAPTVRTMRQSKWMQLADTSGGAFTFNVASVETLSYSHIAGVSTSVTLYLLGTAGDAHLGLAYSPTSETITINQTGTSAFSASASIASPPSMDAPEPAAWVMMLVGFGLSGAVIRRQARNRTASV